MWVMIGLPIMLVILGIIIWLTVTGANVPSQMIARALFAVEDFCPGCSMELMMDAHKSHAVAFLVGPAESAPPDDVVMSSSPSDLE